LTILMISSAKFCIECEFVLNIAKTIGLGRL
jgi:hypothetical protein